MEEKKEAIRTYSGCVHEHDLIKFKDMPKYAVEIDMLGELLTRKMVKVLIRKKLMYVDVVTGSLYNIDTGRCNSSNIQILKATLIVKKTAKKAVKKVAKKAVKKVAKKAVKKAVKKTTKAKK